MPVARKTFTVTGRGPFPVDMLRYDSAWPVDTYDAREIEASWDPNVIAKRWIVRLNTADIQAPTSARWESYNWEVTR